MNNPARHLAQAYLEEAESRNSGPWVAHSRQVALAAQQIAQHHPALDPEMAYIFGLLHDIGRRAGVYGMRHVIDGYRFLIEQGYPEAARICLTHSYPIPNVDAGADAWDGTPADRQFVAEYLAKIEFDCYDRLIQLCDSICLPTGPVLMEKRLLDVALRYGFNEFTLEKWRAFFEIKKAFEAIIGVSIYKLFPGIVENTFGEYG